MTATGHAVIGTVIAATIPNPFIAAPLAIASHLAADIFPHWDLGTHYKKKHKTRFLAETICDVLLGFFLSYLLIIYVFPQTNLGYGFIMIILAQGFDWLWAPEVYFNIKLPFLSWAVDFSGRFNTVLDKPWGIINQVIALVLLVVIARLYFYG